MAFQMRLCIWTQMTKIINDKKLEGCDMDADLHFKILVIGLSAVS